MQFTPKQDYMSRSIRTGIGLASFFSICSQADNFRVARDTSAVGNGKQRKARSADTEPHDYCETRFIENGFVARVRAVGVV